MLLYKVSTTFHFYRPVYVRSPACRANGAGGRTGRSERSYQCNPDMSGKIQDFSLQSKWQIHKIWLFPRLPLLIN